MYIYIFIYVYIYNMSFVYIYMYYLFHLYIYIHMYVCMYIYYLYLLYIILCFKFHVKKHQKNIFPLDNSVFFSPICLEQKSLGDPVVAGTHQGLALGLRCEAAEPEARSLGSLGEAGGR